MQREMQYWTNYTSNCCGSEPSEKMYRHRHTKIGGIISPVPHCSQSCIKSYVRRVFTNSLTMAGKARVINTAALQKLKG